jgi:PleD family two-component response regulator
VRIGDTNRPAPVRGKTVAGAAARGVSAAEPAARPADTATVMGIPEAELTPKVHDAIMALMREVEALRRDLAKSNARLSELEQLADRDALLPMFNRRAFVREMSRMMAVTTRYGTPASLIFFDVNGLKTLNDTQGHALGDQALLHVANTLLENVRGTDVVGRLGGDEFGVLLSHASEDRA